VDSVVYGCTDGSEVRWAVGGQTCRPVSPRTNRPTVGQFATALIV